MLPLQNRIYSFFLAGHPSLDRGTQKVRSRRRVCNCGGRVDYFGTDFRPCGFSALPRVSAYCCDRRRIHSHGERSAAADIFPAVFQSAIRSDVAGSHLEHLVLHQEYVQVVLARSRAHCDGGFYPDHTLWLTDEVVLLPAILCAPMFIFGEKKYRRPHESR